MYVKPLLLIVLMIAQISSSVDAEALEYFRKAEALIGTSREGSDEHARLLEEALAIEPDFAEARINLAIVYHRQGKLEGALQQASLVAEQSPDFPAAYEVRGRVLEEQGRPTEALESFEKAAALAPHNHRLKVLIGRLNHQMGNFGAAASAFRDALQQGGASADLYYNLGLAQRAAGDNQQALDNLKRAAGMDPADVRPHLVMAEIFREQDEWGEALAILLEAEQRDPSDPEVTRQLGTVLLHLGRDKEAKKRLERTSDDDPGVQANLGIVALEQGRWEEAARYFETALEKHSHPVLWGYLGDALSQMGELEEAEQAYRNGLAEDQKDYNTLFNLGALLSRQDRLAEAAEFYNRAIEVRPDAGEAYLQLGIIADRQERSSDAVRYFRQALALGLDNGLIHYRLGFLLAAQGEQTAAVKHFSEAFARDAARFVPPVLEELRAVESPLDSIRYTAEFNELMDRYRSQLRGTAEIPDEHR